ncbi:hypothetical protein ABES02_10080 [Neobacillus pocheonensis]|uniref:hypothetical protein n=1 Tax=Neobacillus pocheonensis TaxID=363869 RepID=UPI003D2B3778
MANLKDKFTIEDIKELDKRLNSIYYRATHGITLTSSGITEIQLLNIIDNLCRASGMLCDVIEQQLEGNIETVDPYGYIIRKIGTAENGIENFLKVKKIDLY